MGDDPALAALIDYRLGEEFIDVLKTLRKLELHSTETVEVKDPVAESPALFLNVGSNEGLEHGRGDHRAEIALEREVVAGAPNPQPARHALLNCGNSGR